MIATFFRWRVDPVKEEEFRARWNAATVHYLTRGSHGSSLWRDREGLLCAFALWPDRATRDAAFADAEGQAHLAPMRGLVDEIVERIDMDQLDNHWRLPNGGQSTGN